MNPKNAFLTGLRERCKDGPHPYHLDVEAGQLVECEPECKCGRKERHTHCAYCGFLISIGDWGAAPIAEFYFGRKKGEAS